MDIGEIFGTAGDALAAIAPTLATAVGGPLAGLAVSRIENWLGVDQADKSFASQLGAALANPEQILALKKEDDDFKKFCLDNALGYERVAAEDRSSARNREIQTRDKVPGTLAFLVTLGFFGILGMMTFRELPATNKDMLNVMLGSLGAAWIAVVSYYFGSSKGSASKDVTINRMVG